MKFGYDKIIPGFGDVVKKYGWHVMRKEFLCLFYFLMTCAPSSAIRSASMVVVRSPAITPTALPMLSFLNMAFIREVFPEPIEPMMSMVKTLERSNFFLFSLAKLRFLDKRSFSSSMSKISGPFDLTISSLPPLAYMTISRQHDNGIGFKRKYPNWGISQDARKDEGGSTLPSYSAFCLNPTFSSNRKTASAPRSTMTEE